jgi:hypothetical protein
MSRTVPRWRLVLKLIAGPLVLVAIVAALLATAGGGTRRDASQAAPAQQSVQADAPLTGELHLTAQEQADWNAATATPEQRAAIVANMQAAFAGVAQINVGTDPVPAPQPAAHQTSVGDMQLIVAYGMSWDHFWVTASYLDMARGAIWAAVGYCIYRGVPSWLCNGAGSTLSSWAQGWGSASNHGVWGAVYWAPPHITGGRW